MIIIADDLTGANDTAVQYQKYGFSTFVKVTHEGTTPPEIALVAELLGRYQVLSVNSDSRPLESGEAYRIVYEITAAFCRHEDCVYKKMDSLFRGNPDTELAAVMDAGGYHMALVAPSFPQNGRKVIGGVLKTGQKKIDAAEFFRKGMKKAVVHIPLEEIRKGTESLKNRIEERRNKGDKVFVLDAETDKDLAVIASAATLIKERKVLSGSAGLAEQLAAAEAKQRSLKRPDFRGIRIQGTRLLAVASRREETAAQVRKAAEAYNVPMILMDSEAAADGNSEQVRKQCVSQLSGQLTRKPEVAIIAVDSLFWGHEMVLRDSEESYNRGRRIVETLGGAVKAACGENRIGAIISTGGDISLQICKAFGVHGIELLDEIMPGIPLGRMVGGIADSMVIITKSGAFGGENALVSTLQYLGREEKLAAAK